MKIGISVTRATFAFIRIMNRYKLSYSTLAFLTIGNRRKPDATVVFITAIMRKERTSYGSLPIQRVSQDKINYKVR